MNVDELAPPSNSLKASDFEGNEATLTIKGYEVREFDQNDNKTGESYKVKKPIFSFHETEKTFVCNRTNLRTIAEVYGKEIDTWVGKKITLFPTMVPFGDKMVEAVRVRIITGDGGQPAFLSSNQGQRPLEPQGGSMAKELSDDIPFLPVRLG